MIRQVLMFYSIYLLQILLLDCPVPSAPQSTSLHVTPLLSRAGCRQTCYLQLLHFTCHWWALESLTCDSHYTTYFIPTSMCSNTKSHTGFLRANMANCVRWNIQPSRRYHYWEPIPESLWWRDRALPPCTQAFCYQQILWRDQNQQWI